MSLRRWYDLAECWVLGVVVLMVCAVVGGLVSLALYALVAHWTLFLIVAALVVFPTAIGWVILSGRNR